MTRIRHLRPLPPKETARSRWFEPALRGVAAGEPMHTQGFTLGYSRRLAPGAEDRGRGKLGDLPHLPV